MCRISRLHAAVNKRNCLGKKRMHHEFNAFFMAHIIIASLRRLQLFFSLIRNAGAKRNGSGTRLDLCDLVHESYL